MKITQKKIVFVAIPGVLVVEKIDLEQRMFMSVLCLSFLFCFAFLTSVKQGMICRNRKMTGIGITYRP